MKWKFDMKCRNKTKSKHRRSENRFKLPLVSRLKAIHQDEGGSISIASVFALLLIVFLLGMVMNSTRQVDRKVKMQNAADQATRAGSQQLARSMNSYAFTNHLLSDVFALTAFFREARDQNAARDTEEILDHWRRTGEALLESEFPRFRELGQAILAHVPLEQELVAAFSEWAFEASEVMLPVFEQILSEEMIPEYQRALTINGPRLAQLAADGVAQRHGAAWPIGAEVRAVLWRTTGDPIGGEIESIRRTLPVVDPVLDDEPSQDQYRFEATQQRDHLAHRYLDEWNDESMRFFDTEARLSQFSSLWRNYTCGHLRNLLEIEYANSNLPMQIRRFDEAGWSSQAVLETDYMLVGVVYVEPLVDRIPRMFVNPISTTPIAFAQAEFFVPSPRLETPTVSLIDQPFDFPLVNSRHRGGLPGNFIYDPPKHDPRRLVDADRIFYPEDWDYRYFIHRQGSASYPSQWDLQTQNWESQLVPATCEQLPWILSRSPNINGVDDIELADLTSLTPDDLQWLNHH